MDEISQISDTTGVWNFPLWEAALIRYGFSHFCALVRTSALNQRAKSQFTLSQSFTLQHTHTHTQMHAPIQ